MRLTPWLDDSTSRLGSRRGQNGWTETATARARQGPASPYRMPPPAGCCSRRNSRMVGPDGTPEAGKDQGADRDTTVAWNQGAAGGAAALPQFPWVETDPIRGAAPGNRARSGTAGSRSSWRARCGGRCTPGAALASRCARNASGRGPGARDRTCRAPAPGSASSPHSDPEHLTCPIGFASLPDPRNPCRPGVQSPAGAHRRRTWTRHPGAAVVQGGLATESGACTRCPCGVGRSGPDRASSGPWGHAPIAYGARPDRARQRWGDARPGQDAVGSGLAPEYCHPYTALCAAGYGQHRPRADEVRTSIARFAAEWPCGAP